MDLHLTLLPCHLSLGFANNSTNSREIEIAENLLHELIQKRVIEETVFQQLGYVSNIHLQEKRNGQCRLIFNLE